jgi:hypothetical protein
MSYERKNPMWTGAEIARLKRFYPVMSRKGLEREFKPRSWGAIHQMAYRLGLERPRHLGGKRDWDAIAKNHTPVFDLPVEGSWTRGQDSTEGTQND